MYNIAGYGQMIADQTRMAAYHQALAHAITPGCIVLDIGTGTGIMAFLACQMGAKHVYAIEPSNAIEVAREIAQANGLDGRITFIQDLSTNITLPQPADVMVSDLRGILPLFENHIPAIVDARTRLLAPNGVLIPQRDTLWGSIVSAPKKYQDMFAIWDSKPFGLDFRPARRIVMNTFSKVQFTPDELLLPPQTWAVLDYLTITEPDVSGTLTWKVSQPGTAHGLAVWFDTLLTKGVGFSCAPDEPELIYGRTFFPFEKPVELEIGDIISVTLQADLVVNDYVWRWNTHAQSSDQAHTVDFRQSTFLGAPLSLQQLHKRASNYTPHLNDEGRITNTVLTQMEAGLNLQTIADDLSHRYPLKFIDAGQALAYVADLSEKFSQ